MELRHISPLALAMLLIACLTGCSDDNNDPVDPGVPEDPRVETVLISPGSATFTAIGEDLTFDAAAFDQEGAPIDTVFTWQSSDLDVVVVDSDGTAVATGLGTAMVFLMAGTATDTAEVTVTLASGPTHAWVATGSGNWNDPDNWSEGEVPGDGDIALITGAGTYTVTINEDLDLEGLILGNESGTQTLDMNGNDLRLFTGGLLPGAELLVNGELIVQGDFAWIGGDIDGPGTVAIASSAEMHLVGMPVNLDATINNNGTLTMHASSNLRVNGSLDNNHGGIVDLKGDAILTVQNDGSFENSGTIQKSHGENEASILSSSGDFSSNGSLLVDTGSLVISGGSLSGIISIESDAMLRQSGNTEIRNANSRGDGPLVIGGRASFGAYPGQIVSLRHVILDSGSSPSISGLGNLLVDYSFIWRRGSVANLGSFTTQIGSVTTFEPGSSKQLSGTNWTVLGEVAGDSNVILDLENGAIISVENAGSWNQTSGGTLSAGLGDTGRFNVNSQFNKTGEGTFVVETEFTCSGTLNLTEGALTVQGDFNLFESGVITGGGTGDLTQNLRLILIGDQSVVMHGTIRPDLEGQPARMDIQGLVDMESTFRLELDVVTSGDFNAESVYFLTTGQAFGGTLALTALQPASDGVDYKVVYSQFATGEFAVTGDEQFDTVIQDGSGVLLRR